MALTAPLVLPLERVPCKKKDNYVNAFSLFHGLPKDAGPELILSSRIWYQLTATEAKNGPVTAGAGPE
jgi:hypothetical protein